MIPTLSWAQAQVWAMAPDAYAALLETLRAGPVTAVPGGEWRSRSAGAVAVLPVVGLLAPRSTGLARLFGGTETDTLEAEAKRYASDSSISSILLDIDSPGGLVAGTPELFASLRAVAARKPLLAFVRGLGASAAYWIASAAGRIVAAPSAITGSVGVLAEHASIGGALQRAGIEVTLVTSAPKKGQGNPYEALSPEARGDIQERVNFYGRAFERDVAAGRGVTAERVRSGFGQGGVMVAPAAKAAGLVDRIGTAEEALALAATWSSRNQRLTAELERDMHRLEAGFSIRETEGWARRETERLQRYVDGFKG